MLSYLLLIGFALRAGAQPQPAPALSTAAAPSPVAREAEPNITVEKIIFALDVSSRTPVGASEVFDDSSSEVYCWNQLVVSRPPANVLHQWYWNDRKVGESVIHLRYHRSRVWSRHKVRPGQWRVEIKDADSGQSIAVGAFPVRKSAL